MAEIPHFGSLRLASSKLIRISLVINAVLQVLALDLFLIVAPLVGERDTTISDKVLRTCGQAG